MYPKMPRFFTWSERDWDQWHDCGVTFSKLPSLTLKAHFQPWCNARRDPISCNTKFPDHCKPSKIVVLKSHPGHIVNCFTINTFAVRHFTVFLQYFEFCPEVSSLDLFVLCEQSRRKGKRSNFSLSRGAWGF